ncbi:hypothetical protein [Pedobacter sp. BS3]|uniref:hypothetical protein n=1 Tax=Pedobacter sp. BS3 TaxID=2567937 RepID=UPI0011ED7157|nr:hypothetical protein [Pedobacter sp. BS3]
MSDNHYALHYRISTRGEETENKFKVSQADEIKAAVIKIAKAFLVWIAFILIGFLIFYFATI